jgi:hypothetical protein
MIANSFKDIFYRKVNYYLFDTEGKEPHLDNNSYFQLPISDDTLAILEEEIHYLTNDDDHASLYYHHNWIPIYKDKLYTTRHEHPSSFQLTSEEKLNRLHIIHNALHQLQDTTKYQYKKVQKKPLQYCHHPNNSVFIFYFYSIMLLLLLVYYTITYFSWLSCSYTMFWILLYVIILYL